MGPIRQHPFAVRSGRTSAARDRLAPGAPQRGASLFCCLGCLFLVPVALGPVGCGEPITSGSESVPTASPATLAGGPAADGPVVLTHGGAGSPPRWSPDCQAAARSAFASLHSGKTALEAAIAGTVVMEDLPHFNAGTGANIRLDGKTIQMDAAVMTSDGNFAAVAAIERVRNPIKVAQAVLQTPHRLLAGEGATRFAHRIGFADIVPTCPEAQDKFRRRLSRLLGGAAGGGYDRFDWRRYWNYPHPPPPSARPVDAPAGTDPVGDTVGTVTRDREGNFAAALSTGGTSLTLSGRVGDVPIYGCGLYAGPAGAVACTGFGEEIIRLATARTVYELMARGASARSAVRQACHLFGEEYSLGVIAIGNRDWAVAANRSMAYGFADENSGDSAGS